MLTSVLTLALFLKFFGTSFLSRVSRRVAERAAPARSRKPAGPCWRPRSLLAALCVLLASPRTSATSSSTAPCWAARRGSARPWPSSRRSQPPASPAWRGRPDWRSCRRWWSPLVFGACSASPRDLAPGRSAAADRRAVALRLRGRVGSDALRRAQPVPRGHPLSSAGSAGRRQEPLAMGPRDPRTPLPQGAGHESSHLGA